MKIPQAGSEFADWLLVATGMTGLVTIFLYYMS